MSEGSSTVRAHVIVDGRVQGVGFRFATAQEASERHLAGWVRNVDTGEVEAVFEGPRSNVESMVAWCWEGPPGAWIRNVRLDWDEPVEGLRGFEIRRTELRGGLGYRE